VDVRASYPLISRPRPLLFAWWLFGFQSALFFVMSILYP